MTNILIGIGGTGAKVVEAALALFTAGLGPSEVHIGLVDQDRSNGNMSRTEQSLERLIAFQTQWQNGGQPSTIDWGIGPDDGEQLDFGSVRVRALLEDRALWSPESDDVSLSDILGKDLVDGRRELFDLLFMPGEHEQDLQLGEGYRGRAHVGAAALAAAMLEDENQLIARLRTLMESGDRREVRIFLVGSAFGGTGAAGFPTLARELHRIRSDATFANRGQVRIGGALMLPYFGFAKPDEDGQPVVTTDELLPKAQLALEYYGKLFESENTFDRFYVLGWDPFFNLGYHEAGNREQRNPPLMPEVFGACAAIDFLDGTVPTASVGDVPLMHVARAGQGIGWPDLPLEGAKEKLSQLLRFCTYWLYMTEPLLKKTALLGSGNWTQKLRGRMKPAEHEAQLRTLRNVCEDVLLWAAGIEATMAGQWRPGLWRMAGLHDPGHRATPVRPAALVPVEQVALPEAAFDELVRQDGGEPLSRGAAAVYDALVSNGEHHARGAHKGYGKVVAAAYRAATVRGEA